MMYDPEYTRKFYNTYGNVEWDRLERTAYGRLQAIIHEDFLLRYIQPNLRILDAGSGPGRFSIIAAQKNARVTVLDISDTQLELAKQKIDEAGQSENIDEFIRGDIADLTSIPDNSYDITVCFGGGLSYVCEKRQKAADELTRVTKPGGTILVSAMCLTGSAFSIVTSPIIEILENPDKEVSGSPPLWPIMETGDLPGFPSHIGMDHAPMHMYSAEELNLLFDQCAVVETAGSNVCLREGTKNGDTIAESPAAWNTLVELEKRLNHDPGLVNSGTHIIMALRKEE